MSDRVLRAGVAVLALGGIAIAGYLTYVHYQPEALICTGGGGCETVQKSSYAELAGVPVALLGLGAFIVMLALVAWDSELAALGFSVYLVSLQAFVIDAWCVWCLVNDLVIVPLLVVLTVWRVRTQGST
jgi:uncharacterized membrane protein